MKKTILEQFKKDKRLSFEGDLVIRKENNAKYVYNKKGNILEKTYADGTKDVCKRDKQGNLLEKTYANGRKYVYDKKGNLLEEIYADGLKYVYMFGIVIKINKEMI